MPSIGCIGLGNMGGALVKALSTRPGAAILGYDTDPEKIAAFQELPGCSPAASIKALLEHSDYVFLAVKPQVMHHLLTDAAEEIQPETCLISIAAGIALHQLQTWSRNRCAMVRVMPNTPALVCSGVSAVCLDDARLGSGQKSTVLDLLSVLGQVHVLPEKDFHAFTALIGSGPAYVYYVMDALVQAGVTAGLGRPLAEQMVAGLVQGSVKLAREGDFSLAELQQMVTSPAGTTIAALNHLDRTAVRGSIIDAVIQARDRSRELGAEDK